MVEGLGPMKPGNLDVIQGAKSYRVKTLRDEKRRYIKFTSSQRSGFLFYVVIEEEQNEKTFYVRIRY